MRCSLVLIFILSARVLFSQNGYIQVNKDSVAEGYLKTYVSFMDGHKGVEFWKTKKDKNPLKIPLKELSGYAIKKDTFKIFREFTPFHNSDIYFDVVEGSLLLSGKIKLYTITDFQSAQNITAYTGGGLLPLLIESAVTENTGGKGFIFVLEDESGWFRALPPTKTEMEEILLIFYPEGYIEGYKKHKGEIKYKTIPDFVELYNSKVK